MHQFSWRWWYSVLRNGIFWNVHAFWRAILMKLSCCILRDNSIVIPRADSFTRPDSSARNTGACHHTLPANHWHCLWEIPPIIAVKSNVTTFLQVLRFVVNMFYCGRVAFTVFKHADIKGVRQRITSTTSLDDGYCEATIPVVKGHHVT